MVSVSRFRRPATHGARGVHKLRHTRQRRPALLRNFDLLRQNHRQLIVRNRNQAVALAMNHGNRRAPVALAAYSPILQAKDDLLFCQTALLSPLPGASSLGLGAGQPVVFPGIHQHAVLRDERQHFGCFRVRDRLESHAESRIPYLVANSKSRSSCAGTLIMAPVP